jgi:hypothetical protein
VAAGLVFGYSCIRLYQPFDTGIHVNDNNLIKNSFSVPVISGFDLDL